MKDFAPQKQRHRRDQDQNRWEYSDCEPRILAAGRDSSYFTATRAGRLHLAELLVC